MLLGRLALGLVITVGAATFSAGQRPAAATAGRAPLVWATDSAAPCVGLTVVFQADSARVQALLGPRWTAAASRGGKTAVSLFVTGCPHSMIGGKAIGPSAIGAVIVPVRGPVESAGDAAARTAAVPIVYGDSGKPVSELFRAFAFDVQRAIVSIGTQTTGGEQRVTFTVVTAAGRIEASAQVADTAKATVVNSRLVGTDRARASEFTGPEWTHRSRATATVRTSGNTLFTQLDVTEMPSAALYDAGLGWRFTFKMP